MSKIEVNHLEEMNPAALQSLADNLDDETTEADSVEIVKALRNYRAIVVRAYTQTLKEGYGGAPGEKT